MNPENQEALAMLAKTSQDLRLPDARIRESQLDELRMIYELDPTDNSTLFAYLNGLIEYYRIDNSIVNPQQMNDAVELVKRSIEISQGQEEQFQYILAMILTGAGRSTEAAEAFKSLMQFQQPNGSGSSYISKGELIYNIGESYYNAGNLVEAEKYITNLKSMEFDPNRTSSMLKKIELKKLGFK